MKGGIPQQGRVVKNGVTIPRDSACIMLRMAEVQKLFVGLAQQAKSIRHVAMGTASQGSNEGGPGFISFNCLHRFAESRSMRVKLRP